MAAVTIAVVLLFFTDLLAFLPDAALAGIVANTVLSLIEVHELREFWHMRQSESGLPRHACWACWRSGRCGRVHRLPAVHNRGDPAGVSAGALRSCWRRADRRHFAPAAVGKAGSPSGLVVYRFGAPLYFANPTLFLDEVEQLVDRAPTPVSWSCSTRRRWSMSIPPVQESCGGRSRCGRSRKITCAVSRADGAFRSWFEGPS